MNAKSLSTEESANSIPIEHAGKLEKAVPDRTVMRAKHIQINATEELDSLTRLANNLYHEATYRM